MSSRRDIIQPQVAELLAQTETTDPREAVRRKARGLIATFRSLFGEPAMPIDIAALASMLGIARSDELPVHSNDAELVPDGSGGVIMRVNPDRPQTRQRFSIGHEICHTFFPGYQLTVQCRPDPRTRDRDDPNDLIETLCDVGAAELLLPLPWFADDARAVQTGDDLIRLANKYRVSREATARRFAENSDSAVAALFLSWKLKPTQVGDFNPNQGSLFGTTAEEEALAARQLRIDYAIPSDAFAAKNLYLPRDKSIALQGSLEAAANGESAESVADLELGKSSGRYQVMAIPVYTPSDERGPNGEGAVVAVIEPIGKQKVRKKTTGPNGPGLF